MCAGVAEELNVMVGAGASNAVWAQWLHQAPATNPAHPSLGLVLAAVSPAERAEVLGALLVIGSLVIVRFNRGEQITKDEVLRSMHATSVNRACSPCCSECPCRQNHGCCHAVTNPERSYEELVDADGKRKHTVRKGEVVIDKAQLGPRVGKRMLIATGTHAGLACEVLNLPSKGKVAVWLTASEMGVTLRVSELTEPGMPNYREAEALHRSHREARPTKRKASKRSSQLGGTSAANSAGVAEELNVMVGAGACDADWAQWLHQPPATNPAHAALGLVLAAVSPAERAEVLGALLVIGSLVIIRFNRGEQITKDAVLGSMRAIIINRACSPCCSEGFKRLRGAAAPESVAEGTHSRANMRQAREGGQGVQQEGHGGGAEQPTHL